MADIDSISESAPIDIEVSGAQGPRGPAGLNAVTSATTSDGSANLALATATVSGLLTAGHIHGNLAGTLYTHVRTGEAMSKGDPFYISGFHVGSSQPIVMRANALYAAKMPAVGVMDADYAANTSSANGIIGGTLSNVNTTGYTVSKPVYVANGGGYSSTAGTISQQIGITERANGSTGAFVVTTVKTDPVGPYENDLIVAGCPYAVFQGRMFVWGVTGTSGEEKSVAMQPAVSPNFTPRVEVIGDTTVIFYTPSESTYQDVVTLLVDDGGAIKPFFPDWLLPQTVPEFDSTAPVQFANGSATPHASVGSLYYTADGSVKRRMA